MSSCIRFVAIFVSLALAVGSAQADLSPCSIAIGKAVEKYVKKKQKAIAKCEDKRSSGALAPTVNCRPADGAVTDTATNDALTSAGAKVEPAITAKCTGPLPPLGPQCNSATTIPQLAACITAPVQDADVDNRNVDTLIGTEYDTNAPVTDVALRTCQATISKNAAKYLVKHMKLGRVCQQNRGKGKVSACPDAATAAKVETARAKLDAAIRAKCTEAQLAASSPPKLDFGFPCEAYKLVSYVRNSGPGDPNANVLPVLDRAIRCLTDAHAHVADRMLEIAFPGTEPSAFADGVAAGDATDTTAIFWTRLPDSTSGALLDVSTDATFTTGVQNIPVSSAVGDDGTVKADVGSLVASTVYFYRFRQGTDTSATGRVKTTPSTSDATTVVRVGWSGDTNAFYRPYNSLDPIRLANPDAWFYIGDTIYGDDALADGVVSFTFADYAGKYRMNRSDQALRNLMEATGTYAQWDDHEVRNDFAGAVPAFAARMAEGNRAFRKYMPLREDGGDPMQLYRSVQMGTSAEFFLIDDRQYRSAKYTCCATASESGFVTTDDDSTCTGGGAGEALVPTPACTGPTAMGDPSRTILGATQLAWLENGLLNSTAKFKFIMNGPPITQLVFLPYDRWEAWSVERAAILDYIITNNIKNVIWLSTDFHTIIFSPVRVDATHNVPELVSGSIGENTLFRELPPTIVGLLPSVPAIITQVSEFELDRYNGVMITLDPAAETANFDFKDRTGLTIHSITYAAVP
jgi:phosphodiesterase/alkaline phosphatase D-like protein